MTNHPHAARIHRRIDLLLIAITIAILVLIVCTSARGQGGTSATWNGNQNNNWIPTQTGPNQNWSTGNHMYPGTVNTTTNLNTATFNIGGGSPTITLNPSLDGGTTLNLQNITFTTASVGAFTIGTTGGPTLRLTNGGTIQMTASVANNETVNAPIELEPASTITAGSYTFLNDATSATNVLTFGGAIAGGTTSFGNSSTPGITLTLGGSNTGANTVSGAISNGGATNGVAVTKTGIGTWNLTGNNTYTGRTTISGGTLNANAGGGNQALGSTSGVVVNGGGTLLLSSSNQINNSATMTLNGGTLRLNGVSEGTRPAQGVGALTLSSSSIVDLANTSLVHFAASSSQTWTGTLSIYNWSGMPVTGNGAEALIFGANTTSLTPAQLNQILFYSDSGTTFLGTGAFATIGDGEVVPVPEPSTWIGGALVVGALGWSQRRRLARLIKRAA